MPQIAVAAAVVGIVAGQFGNPCRDADPARTTLTIVAVFSLPLSAPGLVFNLAHCRDSAGGWLLHAAPLQRPFDLAWGACKAVLVFVVTPLCLALAVTCAVVWGDVLSAVLHAALAWGLTWIMLEGALWLIAPAWPFTLPATKGIGLTLPPLPTAGLGSCLATLAVVHALAAGYAVYWVIVFTSLPLVGWLIRRPARARLARLGVSG